MGQLRSKHITPDIVSEHVGLEFAGPLYLKRSSVLKLIILKSYVCIFVSMLVKAAHLELFSTTVLNPSLAASVISLPEEENPPHYRAIMVLILLSACRVRKELYTFLLSKKTKEDIGNFCSTQGIHRHFIPE